MRVSVTLQLDYQNNDADDSREKESQKTALQV